MNGFDCTILLFPSDQCAVVACANGNTDGDAADWVARMTSQELFGLVPRVDFVKLADEEAIARREDYDRMLREWEDNREQAGTSAARQSSSSLTSDYKDIDIDPINSTTLETRCLPRAPPDPNLDRYCGKYHALNTMLTISRDITS